MKKILIGKLNLQEYLQEKKILKKIKIMKKIYLKWLELDLVMK